MKYQILTLAAALTASPAFGQRIIDVAQEPSCTSCSIDVRTVATLIGSESVVVALSRDSRAVLQGDRYLVTPTYEPGQVAVFDQAGALLQTFGRHGPGPGELTGRSMKVLVGPGDSVHVLDGSTWHLFTPRYGFVRSRTLPASIFDGRVSESNELVISYSPNPTSPLLGGIHAINLRSGNERWFDREGYDNVSSVDAVRMVSTTPDHVWAVRANRYEITRYSFSDSSVTRWQQVGGWLSPWTDVGRTGPFQSLQQPAMMGVQVRDSTLIVYGRTPNPRWRPPVAPRGSEGVPRSQLNLHLASNGLIEVIQQRTGAVLARIKTDEIYWPVRGSATLAQITRALPSGEIALDIVEMTLVAR